MKSVICVQVKNEHRYIREWVEHNLNIGFDCIYIYEDWRSLSHYDVLRDLIRKRKVVLTPFSSNRVPIIRGDNCRGIPTQYQLFSWFFNECKAQHIDAEWIGFFDVDEFLVFDKGWDLFKIEQAFKNYGCVYPCWVMYGANGHVKRPCGNVVDNYTSFMPLYYHMEQPMWYHKSLVNVRICSGMKNIHTFNEGVFTDGVTFTDSWLSFSKCHLNHYFTKSFEDYCERMQSRGNMANNNRCYDEFFEMSPEFQDKEEEMLNFLRFNSKNNDTMWISHKHKIISGGNKNQIEKIRNNVCK